MFHKARRGIETEYARKSFHLMGMGAELYNEQLINLRETEPCKQYEELLKKHFSWNLWSLWDFQMSIVISARFYQSWSRLYFLLFLYRTFVDNNIFMLELTSCVKIISIF